MKKILAMAAAAALATGVSAYAANPFSDVSTDDWAYQAVSALSDQGVVEGYPDGTFKGERNMTRYELAQIIARLMAREDQLNAEQQATVSRLASEYADELANLGVRVSNLEKKVGNISWGGDARMQYQHNLALPDAKNHQDTWNGRLRLNADAAVNDKLTVSGRFVYDMDFQNSEEDTGVYLDRLHALWTPTDNVSVDIGRMGVALDRDGVFWDEDGVFDGAVLGLGSDKLGAQVGYGRFKSAEFPTASIEDGQPGILYTDQASTESWFGKIYGGTDRFQVSAFYLKPVQEFNGAITTAGIVNEKDAEIWGAGLTLGVADKLSLSGDYIQTQYKANLGSVQVDNPALWTAGLTYGEVTDKPGSFSLGVRYVDADWLSNAFGNSALDLTDHLYYGLGHATDITFWQARLGVALQKGVELDAYYSFGAEADNTGVADPDDTWGVELNYAF